MRVKFLDDDYLDELEKKVNKFLAKFDLYNFPKKCEPKVKYEITTYKDSFYCTAMITYDNKVLNIEGD